MSFDKYSQCCNPPPPTPPIKIWHISITQKAPLCSFAVIPPKPTTGRHKFGFYHCKLVLSVLKLVYNRMKWYIPFLCLTFFTQHSVNPVILLLQVSVVCAFFLLSSISLYE